MHIARVSIQSFRCLSSPDEWAINWLPNGDLNLLIGPNGAGKTALVDAIDLVLDCEGRANRALVTEYDFPRCDTLKGIVIEVALTDIGVATARFEDHIQFLDKKTYSPIDERDDTPDDAKHERGVIVRFEANLDKDEGEIRWKWILPKLMETDYAEKRELSRSQHEAIGYFRIQPAISAGAFTLGEYSTLGRHLRRLEYRLGRLPEQLRPRQFLPECRWDCKNCGDKGVCTNTVENDDPKAPAAQPLGKALGAIAERARKMLGTSAWSDMSSSLGPRYGGVKTSLAATTLGLRPSEVGVDTFIPFERLSAGEKYALSFALATTKLKGSNAPIIIMEEPETALYPAAIGQIVASLQADNSPQVIVTSHSESVIRRFALDDIFLMNTQRNPVGLAETTEAGDRLTAEALIAPGKTSALLTEKVIVAEGLEDAIVARDIDRLANEVLGPGKGFASRGWCFLDAGGAPHARSTARLLRAWGKSVAILFDGDADGQRYAATTCAEFPTFTYTSSEVREPTVETALLRGLPEEQRKQAQREFQGDPSCSGCGNIPEEIKECVERKHCSSDMEKRERKRRLCMCCIAHYHAKQQFPRAFASLLDKLESMIVGNIVTLDVDYRQG